MAPSNSCPTEIRLSEHIDGELSENASREIEEHLAHCEACNLVYSSMKATQDLLLEHMPYMDPPDSMRQELLGTISQLQQDTRPWHSAYSLPSLWSSFRIFPLKSRTLAFASIFVVFLVAMISVYNFQRRIDDKRTLAQIERIKTEWAVQDLSRNPFDINGARLQLNSENPFRPYLNER